MPRPGGDATIIFLLLIALGVIVILACKPFAEDENKINVTNDTEVKSEVVEPDLTGTVKPGQIYVGEDHGNPFISTYKILIREVKMGGDGLFVRYSFIYDGRISENSWSGRERSILSEYTLEPSNVTNVTLKKGEE